ncbi:branched-chain-amino-acid aminotransferase 3, chloroplastic-like [Canna indica]|uniref:Branched-chain-amino-acid aminotransferase n=1 Tax=Canna indica TaxID=4628 RepID=A0AAQ3KS47_9LILI|nr:branched-chain-amino-acid aminotransferase 3, chloroplastic-like [Canna indica]
MDRGVVLLRTRAGHEAPLASLVLPLGRIRHGFPSISSLKIQNKLLSISSLVLGASSSRCEATKASFYNRKTVEIVDLDWDNLGFGVVPTDFMYVMKCSQKEIFTKGELVRYGPIELTPSSGVLNYGQGLFEGLKAYRKEDGSILLFRPYENALRMKMGAERMCMPAPTIEQFVDAIKFVVLANKRWIPPTGKGSLYIRPLLIGSGAILGLSPAPEYTFLVFVSPVGNYFKEGLAPISLVVENEHHRAAPGGTGGVKTIGNYASVLKAQKRAKENGYSDVLYLDSVHKKYLEEVSSCNIFIVKNKVISTPELKGTILPGITRKSIIDVARGLGYQVEERPLLVEELLDADEVFCTGTAVVVSPVGSITYLGRRVEYGDKGVGVVSQQLYSALTRLQMGLSEDKMGWTMLVLTAKGGQRKDSSWTVQIENLPRVSSSKCAGARSKPRLIDFVIEFTDQEDTSKQVETWTLFVDDAFNEKRSEASIILENGQGITLEKPLQFQFKAGNNQAEYEALIIGLKLAQEVKARSIVVKSDSQLIVGQVNDTYQSRDSSLERYLSLICSLITNFDSCVI